ncbi:MAG: glycosyltransferase family 2 protein, partial [Desulfobacteraceae bacterium]|nr:glycosyltransferase family 2 protein [Desulfobacteraceae bacterium]
MKSPILSLCVCCRNAASRIEDTLWSLLSQTADSNIYEILVVDNASDDIKQLKALLKNMSDEARKIKLFEEPNIGLS